MIDCGIHPNIMRELERYTVLSDEQLVRFVLERARETGRIRLYHSLGVLIMRLNARGAFSLGEGSPAGSDPHNGNDDLPTSQGRKRN